MRSSRLPCFKVRDSEGAVEPSRIDIAREAGALPVCSRFSRTTYGLRRRVGGRRPPLL